MPIEKLQPHEEQDQQLDQTCRGASSSEKRDFWRHQCQLSDKQQSKGEELALAEGKDQFNGVAIGEKQIILRDHYDKDHPGLAGGVTGILETFGTAAVSWAVKEGLSKLWEFGKNTIMGKKESAEEKLDRLFMSYYETGLDHLKNATKIQDDQRREGSIHNAANNFITAANLIQTGCFVKAKSMLSVAGCHHLIREYDVAKHWLEKAYEEGLAECKRSHTRYELEQFKSEIMVPLEKLLKSYPPTSNSTVPLLTQFGRLEIGSSSTSDNPGGVRRSLDVSERKEFYYDSGEKHRLAGRFNEAIDNYNQVLALDINHAEALSGRGDVKRMLNDYRGALQDLNKSLEIEPNSAYALAIRGDVKAMLNDYRGALQDVNKSLEIEPNSEIALAIRGGVKCMLNDYGGALQDVNKSLEIEPNSACALAVRGDVKAKSNDLRGALRDLNAALEIDPNLVRALVGRGYVKGMLEDYRGALLDLNAALEIEPNSAPALVGRGNMKYSIKDYRGALRDLNMSLEIEPNSAPALVSRGHVYQAMRKDREALADFDRALALDSSQAWVREARDEVRQRMR